MNALVNKSRPNKTRQIDLVNQDIRPIEPEFDTENTLSFYWELWMDVDKYFGTDTRNNDDIWINFYTIYHRDTDKITAEYYYDSSDLNECVDWELTDEEEKFLRDKLEEYCKNDCGLTLKEFFDKYIEE